MAPRPPHVAGATLAESARSGGRARRARAGSARTGRVRWNDRRIRLEHWVETPRFEPAPPRSSATNETSMRPSLPSRAGPLRDDGEPGIPPDDDAPTPGRQANAPTSGWRSDASPAGALVRTQRTARAPTHKPGRARPRPCSPRIAGTVRPRKIAAPHGAAGRPVPTGYRLSIGERVAARSPRRLGCSTTRAFTFSSARSNSSAPPRSSTMRIDH